jgi:hypothetical protein
MFLKNYTTLAPEKTLWYRCKARLYQLARVIKTHAHRCADEGCWRKGEPCFLPGNATGRPDEYSCWEHAHQFGYCRRCGCFWAGVESFEFDPSGLCENCRNQYGTDSGQKDYHDFDDDE